jgi:2-alkyl-3-oxoalkanoate reductase
VRVFVAGATGAIGRRLVPMLVDSGHQVTGMTRNPDRAEALRAKGAQAAVADAYDADAVRSALAGAEPEAVVNELTDIPQALDPRKYAEQMGGNDRIRQEVGPALALAAAEAGARRLVVQSIAFAYRHDGSSVKTEDDPLFDDAPPPLDRSVAALRALEGSALETPGLEGVVLRYGLFYGSATSFAANGATAAQVRKRAYPIVGRGEGITSFIHIDDAASATLAAVERGPAGVYNVVDDEPAPVRVWLPVYASAIGAKPPRWVPVFLARWLAGPFVVALATTARGASNEKIRRELTWSPRHASWRDGFREALG